MSVPRRIASRAFTLLELLVSIAVLAIIVVAAAQIIATAGTLTTINNKHMDANDQARMVFDRMANDFSRMVKRTDVNYIFWKATGNDAIYFFTEGASYFDSSTYNTAPTGVSSPYSSEKNSVSLVGYRVNNNPASAYPSGTNPAYYQIERLGMALSWDGGAYNSATLPKNSSQPNFMVFLSYPPAGTDASTVDNTSGSTYTGATYSTALFNSTIAGAYSNGSGLAATGSLPSAVGTYPGPNATAPAAGTGVFNDSADSNYHSVGTQVFRFEYSFQMKDGTQSVIPVMTPTAANGLPALVSASDLTATAPPTKITDASHSYKVNSRWYDTKDEIGYICLDATTNYAVWHEIGIQDIAAIVVNIAVIDKQGLVFAQAKGIDLANLAAAFPDATSATSAASLPTTWANALLPGGAVSTMTGTKFPQATVSQIRIYQRYFYINNL